MCISAKKLQTILLSRLLCQQIAINGPYDSFKQQQFSNMVCILFILVIKRGQCHKIRILEPFPKFPLINYLQEKEKTMTALTKNI